MHMKQRHQAERNIAWGRARKSAAMVRDGCRQVAMAQRHALRPSGAAAGVQHQRDIVRGQDRGAAAPRPTISGVTTGMPAWLRRPARFGAIIARRHQHLGVRIREIKTELLEFVAGIQRRRCARSRGRQKRHDSIQAIGQRHGHAIAPPHARRVQSPPPSRAPAGAVRRNLPKHPAPAV